MFVKKTQVFLVLNMILCTFNEDREVWIRFLDGKHKYNIATVSDFSSIKRIIDTLGEDDIVYDEIPIHVPTKMATFNTVLSLCGPMPTNVMDLRRKNLLEILHLEEHLAILDSRVRRLFLRNLAKKSLLGAYTEGITLSDRGNVVGHPQLRTRRMSLMSLKCLLGRNPSLPSSNDDDSPPPAIQESFSKTMLLEIMNGLMNVFGTEVRLINDVITICSHRNTFTHYGSVVNIRAVHSVRVIHILQSAQDMLMHRGMLKILVWFATNLGISSLSVRDCTLSHEAIREICVLKLTELDLSNCGLDKNSIALLGDSRSAIKNTLRQLDVSWNKLSNKDLAALCKMEIKSLVMAGCGIDKGDLAVLKMDCVLQWALETLNVSHNSLGIKDMEALAIMKINDLTISSCYLYKGGLVPLANRNMPLGQNLRKLDVSSNDFGFEDTQALTSIGLVTLNMSYCNLPKGSLIALGFNNSVLKYTLRKLEVTGNLNLGSEDHSTLISVAGLVTGD